MYYESLLATWGENGATVLECRVFDKEWGLAMTHKLLWLSKSPPRHSHPQRKALSKERIIHSSSHLPVYTQYYKNRRDTVSGNGYSTTEDAVSPKIKESYLCEDEKIPKRPSNSAWGSFINLSPAALDALYLSKDGCASLPVSCTFSNKDES